MKNHTSTTARAAVAQGRMLLLVLTLLGAFAGSLTAQVVDLPEPGDTVYEVQMTDGSSVFARVTAVDGDQVTLTTVGGVSLTVPRNQIRALEVARGQVVSGEYWRRDRDVTHLFFTATGRSMGAGEGYAGTYMIALPYVAVGVTDHLTLAAGAPVMFGELEPFYVAPKLRVLSAETAHISVGTLAFFFEEEVVGILYGVGTFGTEDRSLTAGLGFGYSGEEFVNEPVAMIGGEARMGRRTKFITENYILPEGTGLVFSGGLRFIGERFSTDIGLAGAAGDGESACCLPIVNFSYAFGQGR